MRPMSLPHLVARDPQFKDGYCGCAQFKDSVMIYALFNVIKLAASQKVPLLIQLHENVAESLPENDVGIVTITPGGALNSLPG